MPDSLTPQEIVAELDKYIVGQAEAKRAVAVALRTRDRRRSLPEDVRKDIMPKNLLLIGPTGVGKTEIARRVAAMLHAPFIKVEATRFTEVGYVGRDVESIVRDLSEVAVEMVHKEKLETVKEKADRSAYQRVLEYLCQQYPSGRMTSAALERRNSKRDTPATAVSATGGGTMAVATPAAAADAGRTSQGLSESATTAAPAITSAQRLQLARRRMWLNRMLRHNKLDDVTIEVELSVDGESLDSVLEFAPDMSTDEMTDSFHDFMSRYQQRKQMRRLSVKEARKVLAQDEADKLLDWDDVVDTALQRATELGVVFIDELDKLAGPAVESGADVSGEGVQRDLLPIVEGTSVMTRYGQMSTDHMLFIAAGSFYASKPGDLIPELQGRFPLRVELAKLTKSDFVRILKEPRNALTKQYQALLSTEEVTLQFADSGVEEIASLACQMNDRLENIGARRLATITERVLEDLSFDAASHKGETITIDQAYVASRMASLVGNEDLSRYIL
ncbi:MAG: ATP-dependent protease ATPase subunit HslU [Chloroflexota bacterium]|nr:ATP-dependent protease ATPase subunit HslU [Chloroflexota bacterium]